MRAFPDTHEHFERCMDREAEKYIAGLKRAGIARPSNTLTSAMIERALDGASASYAEEANKVLEHNVKAIVRERDRQINKIRRQARRQRRKYCLPIALLFAIASCCDFSLGTFVIGICFAIGAVICPLKWVGLP